MACHAEHGTWVVRKRDDLRVVIVAPKGALGTHRMTEARLVDIGADGYCPVCRPKKAAAT